MPCVPIAAPRRLVAATAAVLLWLCATVAMPALAQASRFAAEIVHVDMADKRVTLKASMGQQTMRVVSAVVLEALKPGDKVLVTFGQSGKEAVITSVEVLKR
jgi:Cu/Ag efflux protein CusF